MGAAKGEAGVPFVIEARSRRKTVEIVTGAAAALRSPVGKLTGVGIAVALLALV